MSSEKMITRLVFDTDKKRMVRKKFPAPVPRISVKTQPKTLAERVKQLTEDRGSLEMDKWELLYCLYGRANVRFG